MKSSFIAAGQRECKCFECKAFMWQGKESVKSTKIILENKVCYCSYLHNSNRQTNSLPENVSYRKNYKTIFLISVFWNGMHLKLGCFVCQLIMTLSHIPNKEPIPESSTANYVLLLKGATGIKGILGKWWVCVSLPYEPM